MVQEPHISPLAATTLVYACTAFKFKHSATARQQAILLPPLDSKQRFSQHPHLLLVSLCSQSISLQVVTATVKQSLSFALYYIWIPSVRLSQLLALMTANLHSSTCRFFKYSASLKTQPCRHQPAAIGSSNDRSITRQAASQSQLQRLHTTPAASLSSSVER
jgi:hypothetical protein